MNRKLTGSTLLLFSAVIFGLFGVFSRYISEFGSFSQSWVRSLIIFCVLFFIFSFGKLRWKKIEKKDVKWFLVWIVPCSFQPVMTFAAFNHLPLGTTYFLIYSTMILGGIISGKVFFSEIFSWNKRLSLVLLFTGLFLIYRSDILLIKSVYVFLALLSGLLLGFWNTLTKKVSGNYSELQMMLLDNVATLMVCLIGATVIGEKLPAISSYNSWLWIIIFGVSSVLSMFLLIRGFKYVEAQVGSLILPVEIVFASIFGYLVFGEILKLNMYLGGFFILVAALLTAIKFSKQ